MIDCIDSYYLDEYHDWSKEAFGPGLRTGGIIDHIRKEIAEVEACPVDIEEWIDIAILAINGASRAAEQHPDCVERGMSPGQKVIEQFVKKSEKVKRRRYPDWRTVAPGTAVEHIRDEPAMIIDTSGIGGRVEKLGSYPEIGDVYRIVHDFSGGE